MIIQFYRKKVALPTFSPTVMNEGSGEWWLYGEDKDYFYAFSDEEGIAYHAFPKGIAAIIDGFDPTDKMTWPPDQRLDEHTHNPLNRQAEQDGAAKTVFGAAPEGREGLISDR